MENLLHWALKIVFNDRLLKKSRGEKKYSFFFFGFAELYYVPVKLTTDSDSSLNSGSFILRSDLNLKSVENFMSELEDSRDYNFN